MPKSPLEKGVLEKINEEESFSKEEEPHKFWILLEENQESYGIITTNPLLDTGYTVFENNKLATSHIYFQSKIFEFLRQKSNGRKVSALFCRENTNIRKITIRLD